MIALAKLEVAYGKNAMAKADAHGELDDAKARMRTMDSILPTK